MSVPLLNIDVQRKSFGERLVLHNAQVQLHAGEVVSLLGPSGCGKSTLLRIAAGLERDYSGRLQSNAQHIGLVFQEPRLMPWLDVQCNIGFVDGSGYDRTWVRQLLVEVGLADYAGALPKALSGGMAQRVAIARGLYSRPQVLLLDEPFSAVDAFTRMKLQDLLLDLATRHRIALLLVTHDVDEALYLSDRVLIMGNRPSNVRDTLTLDLPRPRERRQPRLAEFKAQALTALHQAQVI